MTLRGECVFSQQVAFRSWISPIVAKGWKKDLDEDDVYKAAETFESARLGDRIEELWMQEKKSPKPPSLLRVLRRQFGWELCQKAILFFPVEFLVVFLQPFLVLRILGFYASTSDNLSKNDAYIYTSVLILLSVLRLFTHHRYFVDMQTLGMKMRVACCSLIYRKALTLTTQSLKDRSVGRLVNLMANDVSRFELAIPYVHFLWVAPVQFLLGIYYVYALTDYTGRVGLVVIVPIVLFQIFAILKMGAIRRRVAVNTDHRIRLISDIIGRIRVIKMYTWEKPFGELVRKARRLEVDSIFAGLYFRLIISCFLWFASRLSVFLCVVVVHLVERRPLSSQYVFSVSAFYENLKNNVVVHMPLAAVYTGELRTSLQRIEEVLLAERSSPASAPCLDVGIRAENITVRWNETDVLTGVNFTARSQQLVGVVGASGSGKSTLLQAVLREVEVTAGELDVKGRLSYAPQEAWIFSASVQQNILFGEAMVRERYEMVVRMCALEHDLKLFPYGDRTLVGERGLMLSGGQKARIGLARAVYRDADIYLLDDPLAAVDAHVARQICAECVCGLLKDKCVVLATHQVHQLKRADRIYVLKDGKSVGYEEMVGLERSVANEQTFDALDDNVTQCDSPVSVKEQKSSHKSSAYAYKKYFSSGGVGLSCMTIVMFSFIQVLSSSMDYFMMLWVNQFQDGDDSMTIYGSLLLLSFLLLVPSYAVFVKHYRNVCITLHDVLLERVMRSTMHFFSCNSSGRILNRFVHDMGCLDEAVPMGVFNTINMFLLAFGTIAVIVAVNPWMVLPTCCLFLICYVCYRVFHSAFVNMKKTASIAMSPVFNHVTVSLQGGAVIRAFGVQKLVQEEFDRHQNLATSAKHLAHSLHIMLGFWIDLVGVIYTAIVCFSFFAIETSSAGVGLAVTQSLRVSAVAQNCLRVWSELETKMTSVERIVEFSELTPEADAAKAEPASSWPERGKVEFQSVSLRYTKTGPFVLNSVSLVVNPGEKIGIVGRTGAGKSSVISALFRLYDFEGRIVVDGVDSKDISLRRLRSTMSIITQDPVLFLGTLRKNLDPFDEFSDEELWGALEEIDFKKLVGGLDTPVAEGGSNFSVGQRQLVCLVRAMLRNVRIIVLDEATANIDFQTDKLIQATIRRKFKGCTMLTVAHRLNTVMDSDKILVLNDGVVVEFGAPKELVQDSNGWFYKYVMQSDKKLTLF